jgi:hypothetical protein
MLKVPLDDVVPKPLIIETAPPYSKSLLVASPALNVMRPPDAFAPLPTMTLTLPPCPFNACPERSLM